MTAVSAATLAGTLTSLEGCGRSKQSSAPAPLTDGKTVGKLLLKHFKYTASGGTVKPSRVIVVGAGTAGLSAARILHDAGVETVVIEARERMGGRTWTRYVGGMPNDMNGGMIHDIGINPLYRVYTEAGWPTIDRPSVREDIYSNVYDATSGKMLGLVGKARLLSMTNRFDKGPAPANLPHTAADDYPVERWIEQFMASSGLEGADRRLVETVLRTETNYNPNKLSMLWSYVRQAGLHGGRDILTRDGYSFFVERLADGLDVQLECPVSRIEANGDGVTVIGASGTFKGSHVIVAVPAGVLKRRSIEFAPGLSAAKLSAIDDVAESHMEKIVMLLPRDLGSSFSSRIYYDEVRNCRMAYANQAADMGKPIMHVYVHTDYVEQFVKFDLKEREDIVVSALRQMVGDPSLTPVEFVQSDWTNSPYTGGSFGMIKVHQSPDAFQRLSTPELGGRVLFAGEATDHIRFAYVDGAVGSGIREARRLLSA